MKIKVAVLENNKLEVKEIENNLKTLQEIVGGLIEIPYISDKLSDNGIDIIINEEGKLIDGLRPEIAIVNKKTSDVIDLVFGTCIFASSDNEGGTIGLSEEQIGILFEMFKENVLLTSMKDGVFNVKFVMI